MPNTAQAPAPKPAQSEGRRPSVPDWLSALGIKDGEYFSTSKLREQRASKARCIGEAGRVHACLGLHTMGFQQEEAVKMAAGKRVPLSPADIEAETGVRRDHVMRAMAQLKAWGLADYKGSTKGQLRLYAWAVPRPVEREPNCTQVGYNNQQTQQNQQILPPLVLKLLKRYKISLLPDFVPARGYILEVEEAARALAEAEMALKRALKGPADGENGTRARDRINKEERNERNISISEGSSSSSALCSLVETAEEEEPPPEEKLSKPKPPEPIEEVQAAYPPAKWDAAKAVRAYRQTIRSAAEHKKLLEGLARHKQSERWRDNEGRWIPFASNFISQGLYAHDPPPKFTLSSGKKQTGKVDVIALMLERERAKAKGGGA